MQKQYTVDAGRCRGQSYFYITSQMEVPVIETDKLTRASDTIQQNIVTYERKFEFSMKPEKVRKIIKTMPVMYLKSQTKLLLINMHEYVLIPRVFESILVLGKPANSEVEGAKTEHKISLNTIIPDVSGTK